MSNYAEALSSALSNPPDPLEPLPLANRRETILGVILLTLIFSWFAVALRLWVRFKVVREPGWDDFFVLLAAICNTVSSAIVGAAVQNGLGKHMIYLPTKTVRSYIIEFYTAHSLYLMETAIIKISLLLQLLRIFKAGIMRTACLILIALISLWGIGYTIVGWFPCFPVHGVWDREIGATCYGFGFSTTDEFASMYMGHAASNMVLDITIFLLPLVLFKTPNLKLRSLVSMSGVFCIGGIVVATSVWRLYEISLHRAATYPYLDFTWYGPLVILLSSTEIGLAITCASIPIFWPLVERRFAAIIVSHEVKVTVERVKQQDYGLAYELEHKKHRRGPSIESTGSKSLDPCIQEEYDFGKMARYSIMSDPFSEGGRPGHSFQATVQTAPKSKWDI